MKTESLEVTEQLGASGATAQRITLQYIVDQIDQFWFTTADRCLAERQKLASSAGLSHVTLCLMLMKSGFVVIGKSAPLSPENFDAVKGQTFAYEDAIRQLWPMFAFHQLQEKV